MRSSNDVAQNICVLFSRSDLRTHCYCCGERVLRQKKRGQFLFDPSVSSVVGCSLAALSTKQYRTLIAGVGRLRCINIWTRPRFSATNHPFSMHDGIQLEFVNVRIKYHALLGRSAALWLWFVSIFEGLWSLKKLPCHVSYQFFSFLAPCFLSPLMSLLPLITSMCTFSLQPEWRVSLSVFADIWCDHGQKNKQILN